MPRSPAPKQNRANPARPRRSVAAQPAPSLFSPEVQQDIVLGDPDPSPLQRRIALLTIIGIVLVMGVAGAVIELTLKPMLAYPPHHPPQEPQVVHMQVVNQSYLPSVIAVRVGQPVQWVIDSTQASGCTETLVVPQLEIERLLSANETVITFLPSEIGVIPFSCGTAAVQGRFEVS